MSRIGWFVWLGVIEMNSYGRDILILSVLFLVNSLAIELISPIWPIFIGFLGASMTELGLVFAVSNAVGAAMQIPGGLLSDRFGRRRLHVVGTLLAIFPPLMYALANSWTDLIPWIALAGFAAGTYMPIRWSIIADVSSSTTMASAFSWANIAWLIGSTAAPFIGGLAADLFGITFPFLACFILRFAALPLAVFFRETKKKPVDAVTKSHPPKTGLVERFQSTLILITLINLIQGLGMGVTGPIIPVFVATNFQVDYTFIGILYAVGFGVASIIVQTPGARLSNRFDRRKIMFVTFVTSAPFFLIFAYSRSTLELILFMFLSNLILNLHWPAYQTYLMDATPPPKWGFVNGVSATTFWAGVMMGNVLSGVLWDAWGMLLPFIVSSLAIGLSALPLILMKETEAKHS